MSPHAAPDHFDLVRFVEAQDGSFDTALAEIRAGRKRSHWIWFVFPQLRGLGTSPTSIRYGIDGLPEARAYLAHPLLGSRLRAATKAMVAQAPATAASVLGELDAMKLRSCLTLFAAAAPDESLFVRALDELFDGERDHVTLTHLASRSDA